MDPASMENRVSEKGGAAVVGRFELMLALIHLARGFSYPVSGDGEQWERAEKRLEAAFKEVENAVRQCQKLTENGPQ